jgi:hypothetical protein
MAPTSPFDRPVLGTVHLQSLRQNPVALHFAPSRHPVIPVMVPVSKIRRIISRLGTVNIKPAPA